MEKLYFESRGQTEERGRILSDPKIVVSGKKYNICPLKLSDVVQVEKSFLP